MNTQEIATKLVELLRFGKFGEAQSELFDEQVISIEPASSQLPATKGLKAILAKGEQFRNSVETWHGITVSDPIISNNHFTVRLKVDLTFKGQEPSTMDELIVYNVEAGKIKQEQFFY